MGNAGLLGTGTGSFGTAEGLGLLQFREVGGTGRLQFPEGCRDCPGLGLQLGVVSRFFFHILIRFVAISFACIFFIIERNPTASLTGYVHKTDKTHEFDIYFASNHQVSSPTTVSLVIGAWFLMMR